MKEKTNNIKPDPNQPRTKFAKDEIKSLAKSYKTLGLVDPIEVDENNIIIRGERRWRAAKLANLDEVPIIKVNNISTKERLERQLLESQPHSRMDKAWSYATAIININQSEKQYTIPEVKKLDKERLLNLLTVLRPTYKLGD